MLMTHNTAVKACAWLVFVVQKAKLKGKKKSLQTETQTVPKCTRHKVTKNTEGTSGKTNHLVKLALKENGKICLDKFEKLII